MTNGIRGWYLLTALLGCGFATADDVPRAVVERSEIDLGAVTRGQEVDARFVVRNAGTVPLEISEVEAGCSCTVVEFDRTIGPGREGSISARLVTRELSGAVGKGIVVHTNDPEEPLLRLTVRAEIVSSLVLLPGDAVFLRERGGGPPIARFLVRHRNGAPLELADLRSSTGWLEASMERLDRATPRGAGVPAGRAGDWLVTVRSSADAPPGRVREQVRFSTGIADESSASVEILGDLAPPVELSRTRLVLPADPPSPVTETMFVAVRKDVDPSELRVEARPDSLAVELEPAGGRLVRVRITWPGGELADAGLTIRLGDGRWSVPISERTAAR